MTQRYAHSERLRAARIAAGMSVPELATVSGVMSTTIYRIESGQHANPQMRTVRALARALKVPVDRLVAA